MEKEHQNIEILNFRDRDLLKSFDVFETEFLFSVATSQKITIFKVEITKYNQKELFVMNRPDFITGTNYPTLHLIESVNEQKELTHHIYITWENCLFQVNLVVKEKTASFVEEGFLLFENTIMHFGQMAQDVFSVVDEK